MSRAIGMIEFKTVASGITAADQMVKTSDVELLEAQTVCPGIKRIYTLRFLLFLCKSYKM